MPTSYKSIFEGDKLITRKDLCKLLNLNLERPDLKFSEQEINSAFRRRAVRFHPDKQATQTQAIPEATCKILMNDIKKAQHHLLKGDTIVSGTEFGANPPTDWVEFIKSQLATIKESASVVSDVVYWANFASRTPALVILFSTYSNNHLNFRFLSLFADLLHSIQPYAKHIDGILISKFLRYLKFHLDSIEQIDGALILSELKKALPEKMANDAKLDSLIDEIEGAVKAIKELLTENFINNVQSLIGFWGQFIANVPTWGQITGVYFVALLFTANSLPKYFNALIDLSKIIIQFKETLPFALVALPMYLLATAMLPLNLAIQCGWFLLQTAVVTAAKLIYHSYKLLSAVYGLVFAKDNEMLAAHGFLAFEAFVNITVNLSIRLLTSALDTVVFMISNMNLGATDKLNYNLDSMFDYLRPEGVAKLAEEKASKNKNSNPIPVIAVAGQSPKQDEEEKFIPQPAANNGFFKNQPLFNEEDTFLDELLASVVANEEHAEPFAAYV